MEYLASLVDSLAWPVIIFVMFCMLRAPLMKLIPFVKNIKYGDLEVEFDKAIKEVKANIEISKIELKPSSKEKEEIDQLLKMSPSSAIVESWKEIEIAAREKITQLIKDKAVLSEALQRPLLHLAITGTFIPSTADAIRGLEFLHNKVARTSNLELSKDNILKYVTLAKTITKQINAITEIPKQKLRVLTLLISEFNHLIDTGKYKDITIEDIHVQIENKSIIEYLRKKTAGDSDFSMFTADGPYSEYLSYYYEQMHSLCGAYAGNENRKWGVENSGLCLLVAWTNELIQQGSGWHPLE